MPNWVYQTLIVFEGNPKEVWDAIRGDESLFDFNRLIPMPSKSSTGTHGRWSIGR